MVMTSPDTKIRCLCRDGDGGDGQKTGGGNPEKGENVTSNFRPRYQRFVGNMARINSVDESICLELVQFATIQTSWHTNSRKLLNPSSVRDTLTAAALCLSVCVQLRGSGHDAPLRALPYRFNCTTRASSNGQTAGLCLSLIKRNISGFLLSLCIYLFVYHSDALFLHLWCLWTSVWFLPCGQSPSEKNRDWKLLCSTFGQRCLVVGTGTNEAVDTRLKSWKETMRLFHMVIPHGTWNLVSWLEIFMRIVNLKCWKTTASVLKYHLLA